MSEGIATSFLGRLNEEQRTAVVHAGGPALILAGAGSGKTRVLTHRIAYLVAQGVAAYNILAVTFTNKAAAEMKNRVESLCGLQPDLWIGTFHSMCARLLRSEISRLGMPSHFTILDEQDQLTVIKEALADLRIDPKVTRPKTIREGISKAKNLLWTPAQVKDQDSDAKGVLLAAVYEAYQKKLFANCALDFDDLLMATVKLFQKDTEVLAKYSQKFQHVLIDEYQDTNHAQYTLIRLLASQSKNVFAVGDEDQSIYSFRGARIQNILDFEQDFAGTRLYRLQQNYRSSQNILSAANALIQCNRRRKGKILWTQNGDGDKVLVFRASDEHAEVDFILDTLQTLHAQGTIPLEEIVIFYRIHALSRVFEEGLRQRGIPYGIVGGVGFYERKEIKDAIAYLRVLVNPADSLSLRRILNVPARGIGPSTLNLLNDRMREHSSSLLEALKIVISKREVHRSAQQNISKLLGLIEKGHPKKQDKGITQTLLWVLKESGYAQELERENTIEAKTRLENLQELQSVSEEFEQRHPEASLEEFLNDIALWTDLDRYDQTDKKVTLMTLHSSKGLEFSGVFIAGLEEGVFPYAHWGVDKSDMEEERRLLYVGITRAKKRLYLSCATSRMLFGERKYLDASRFLEEIRGDFLFDSNSQISASHRDSLYDDVPSRPTDATQRALANLDFSEGESILHPQFGQGRILTCYDRGENLKLTVQFQSEEYPRILAAKYARLKKIRASGRG